MIQGIILLGLTAFMWFGVVKRPEDEAVTGFVKIFKAVFGQKGYILTAKILTAFCAIAAIGEFYRYFFSAGA